MPRRSADDSELENIPSEAADRDVAPASYDIVTYPADYTLEGLNSKYGKTIIAPGFQRKYVWTIKQASRLIESFLLGLPVPAIFLYADSATNKFLVVDGQQRLMSVHYFFEGYFDEPDTKGNRTVFRLQGLNEKSPYSQKTYEDLRTTDEAAFSRLNESVLRAFIVKQLRPEGSSSIYHIFERLNTGGTQLVGQEIRNCVYHGPFNESLISMNRMRAWRSIYGRTSEDKRQRDVELVLRFLALYFAAPRYKKPMKEFLNTFMDEHKRDDEAKLVRYRELFERTSLAVLEHLGPRPFHVRAGLNVAAFDGVYVAFAHHLDSIPSDVAGRYEQLLANPGYLELISSATTDEEVVRERLRIANATLFG